MTKHVFCLKGMEFAHCVHIIMLSVINYYYDLCGDSPLLHLVELLISLASVMIMTHCKCSVVMLGFGRILVSCADA